MNILLIGFKQCGKTYYGLRVAEKLHKNFIDSDLLIEQLYTKIHHKTLTYREIAKKHGFAFFRDLERQVVPTLIQAKDSIISLGGGMVLDPENVERLHRAGFMVFLKTDKETLLHRILSHDPPLYLDSEHPQTSFEAVYQARLPIYERTADYVIDTTGKKEGEVLEDLVHLVEEISCPLKPRQKAL